MRIAPPLPKAASRGAKRINVAGKHTALSAPRQTTAPASDARPGSFDFARAASQLTDAASRAGAAIMGHFREAPEVEIKGDKRPVTRADRDSEAIILEALARLAPGLGGVSEGACGGRRRALSE